MVHIPLRLTIDGEALVSNWHWLAHRSGGAACGAAVKADGYGLGAREAVKRLQAAGCRDFFVATWAEARALMPWPSDLSLSVLHGVQVQDLPTARRTSARPVLNSPEQIARWRETGLPCDVMVDTGMNRLGLTPEQARSGLLDGLRIETLMSHLACADEPDHEMNERQLALFGTLRNDVAARRYSLANSAGICLGPDYAFDLTRPGLALYGGVPVPTDPAQQQAIRPVAAIEAQIVQVKLVPQGGSVGYGATYVAPAPTRIAILNIGYGDGYLRQLAGKGYAMAGEARCPIVGRISMDLIAVGLPSGVDADEGDWLHMPFRLAELAGPLSQYELLTSLGSRFKRSWR
jgi:alanine racemase